MFLTKEELVALTGRKQNISQQQALKDMNIYFVVNPLGEAVVLLESVKTAFKQSCRTVKSIPKTELNLDW